MGRPDSKVGSVKMGIISRPKGALIEDHELAVARILACTGNDVKFIPASTTKTPDIHFCGLDWEIKSPVGSSSRTVENNFRHALTQSKNVIIDLSRIKRPEECCIRDVKRQLDILRNIGAVLVITKARKIIRLR